MNEQMKKRDYFNLSIDEKEGFVEWLKEFSELNKRNRNEVIRLINERKI